MNEACVTAQGRCHLSRLSAGLRLCAVAALAFGACGCAAPQPTINQGGAKSEASADSANLLAKLNDVNARLDLAYRKIDNSREINQDASRDIINKEIESAKQETIAAAVGSVQNIGTGQWAQLLQTVAIFMYLGWAEWCQMRARNGHGRNGAGAAGGAG